MNKTATSIVILAVGVLSLGCFYFLFSPSNSFVISSNIVPKPDLSKSAADNINGQLAAENKNSITLLAVGDIMLSRNVEQKMIAKNDWKYPFEKTSDITSSADLTFGNLETTILKGDAVKSGSFYFRTDPKAVEGLQSAGFDVLSLANNHMMNFSREGIDSTIKNLDAAGISHAGAGLSEDAIYQPVIREVKGIKFGFLAYSYSNDEVTDKKGGIYGVAEMDVEKMKTQVASLRKIADVVVVSMHAGTEYATEPSGAQVKFARAAVDAGADLVIGHHPHVVETFEKYKSGYIIYSLGNFVFDQMFSDETRLGTMAKITFDGNKIAKVDFIPIKIFDYAQPAVADGSGAEKILGRLKMKGE